MFSTRIYPVCMSVNVAVHAHAKHPYTRPNILHTCGHPTTFVAVDGSLIAETRAKLSSHHSRIRHWTDFGQDFWFLQVLGAHYAKDRVAVVDAVTCINPHDWNKAGFEPPRLILGDSKAAPSVTSTREIDRLGTQQERMAAWRRIAKENGLLSKTPMKEYATVNLSAT